MGSVPLHHAASRIHEDISEVLLRVSEVNAQRVEREKEHRCTMLIGKLRFESTFSHEEIKAIGQLLRGRCFR